VSARLNASHPAILAAPTPLLSSHHDPCSNHRRATRLRPGTAHDHRAVYALRPVPSARTIPALEPEGRPDRFDRATCAVTRPARRRARPPAMEPAVARKGTIGRLRRVSVRSGVCEQARQAASSRSINPRGTWWAAERRRPGTSTQRGTLAPRARNELCKKPALLRVPITALQAAHALPSLPAPPQ
jgi:hypothetical protein